jgi:hypothetical protein
MTLPDDPTGDVIAIYNVITLALSNLTHIDLTRFDNFSKVVKSISTGPPLTHFLSLPNYPTDHSLINSSHSLVVRPRCETIAPLAPNWVEHRHQSDILSLVDIAPLGCLVRRRCREWLREGFEVGLTYRGLLLKVVRYLGFLNWRC